LPPTIARASLSISQAGAGASGTSDGWLSTLQQYCLPLMCRLGGAMT